MRQLLGLDTHPSQNFSHGCLAAPCLNEEPNLTITNFSDFRAPRIPSEPKTSHFLEPLTKDSNRPPNPLQTEHHDEHRGILHEMQNVRSNPRREGSRDGERTNSFRWIVLERILHW
jgi:hypothetical protein